MKRVLFFVWSNSGSCMSHTPLVCILCYQFIYTAIFDNPKSIECIHLHICIHVYPSTHKWLGHHWFRMAYHLFGATPLSEPLPVPEFQGTIFSEIWIEIPMFSLKKIHTKMSSANYRPFCSCLNVWYARVCMWPHIPYPIYEHSVICRVSSGKCYQIRVDTCQFLVVSPY